MPKPTFFNLPEPKRQRIIDCALDEFADKPYRQASLSAVVARAGISKGSIYQYFDNKLDLYTWLLLEYMVSQKVRFLAEHGPPEGTGFFELVEYQIHTGIRWVMGNPRLARLGDRVYDQVDDPELAEVFDQARHKGISAISAMVVQAQADGDVRADVDPGLAAALLMAVLREGTQAALADRLGVSLLAWAADPALRPDFDDEARRQYVASLMTVLRAGLQA